jgi:hypothetical protein
LYTFEPWINIGQTRRLQWSIFLLVFWRQYRKRNRDVYIWANYSVSSYLNFIPICWNVLIWLKYDFIHISMHHLVITLENYNVQWITLIITNFVAIYSFLHVQ